MSSSDCNNDVEKFLERILEHQDAPENEALTADSLRDLAQKYGLDESAFEELQQEAEKHKTRGLLFFKNENWDDAIAELDQAYVLRPHDVELGFTLGKAYAGYWKNGGTDDDRVKAEKLFRQCIERNPNSAGAVRELTQLENDAASTKPARKAPIAMLAVLALVLTLLGIWFTPPRFTPVSDSGETQGPPKATQPLPPTFGSVSIPATFPVAETSADFTFTSRSSLLTLYPGKFSYEFQGTILTGSVTIEEMRARLELIGEDETIHATHDIDILPNFRSPSISGDSIPFRALIFNQESAPPITEARFTLLGFDHTPFSGEVTPGEIVAWETRKTKLPPNYDFELRERNVLRSEGSLGDEDKTLLKLIFSLENTGKRPIEKLTLTSRVFDSDGDEIPLGYSKITKHFKNQLPAGEINAVHKINPSLLPGETRAVEASIYLLDTSPEDVGDYVIELLGIE